MFIVGWKNASIGVVLQKSLFVEIKVFNGLAVMGEAYWHGLDSVGSEMTTVVFREVVDPMGMDVSKVCAKKIRFDFSTLLLCK